MDRFDTARALVLAAGARLRLARPEAGAVWEKTGHQDLVTRCDRETEQFLRSGILSAFPGDAIVGEEYPATPPGGTGCVWYLDPRTMCLPSALCWTLNAAHCTPPGTAAAHCAMKRPFMFRTAACCGTHCSRHRAFCTLFCGSTPGALGL